LCSDGDDVNIAGFDVDVSGKPGEIEALSDRDIVYFGIFGSDQDDTVAEQIDPGRYVDVLFADGIIHPVGVGGHEDVRGRTLLDLPCERRTRGIAGIDLDAGLRGERGVDVVKRVLHRGGGEYGEDLVLGESGRSGRSAQDREGCE